MKNIKILIVDDAFFIRNLIKRAIVRKPDERYTFEICGEVDNCNEAIDFYESLKPDIMTIDLNIPGGGGLELIKNIKKINPNMPIIVISSNSDENVQKEVISLDCFFIKKPFQEAFIWTKLDLIVENILMKNSNISIETNIPNENKEEVPSKIEKVNINKENVTKNNTIDKAKKDISNINNVNNNNKVKNTNAKDNNKNSNKNKGKSNKTKETNIKNNISNSKPNNKNKNSHNATHKNSNSKQQDKKSNLSTKQNYNKFVVNEGLTLNSLMGKRVEDKKIETKKVSEKIKKTKPTIEVENTSKVDEPIELPIKKEIIKEVVVEEVATIGKVNNDIVDKVDNTVIDDNNSVVIEDNIVDTLTNEDDLLIIDDECKDECSSDITIEDDTVEIYEHNNNLKPISENIDEDNNDEDDLLIIDDTISEEVPFAESGSIIKINTDKVSIEEEEILIIDDNSVEDDFNNVNASDDLLIIEDDVIEDKPIIEEKIILNQEKQPIVLEDDLLEDDLLEDSNYVKMVVETEKEQPMEVSDDKSNIGKDIENSYVSNIEVDMKYLYKVPFDIDIYLTSQVLDKYDVLRKHQSIFDNIDVKELTGKKVEKPKEEIPVTPVKEEPKDIINDDGTIELDLDENDWASLENELDELGIFDVNEDNSQKSEDTTEKMELNNTNDNYNEIKVDKKPNIKPPIDTTLKNLHAERLKVVYNVEDDEEVEEKSIEEVKKENFLSKLLNKFMKK